MSVRLIIESFVTVSEQAKLNGIAAVPRISRNGNLYTKTELARADGVRVPLNWEHDGSKIVGEATFHYNPELEQLFYEATVTDEPTAALVRNKKLFTSIEADVRDVQQICNGPRDCFAMPIGLEFRALALTEAPGIPETSVVVEHYIGLPPHSCPADSSLVDIGAKAESMTKEDKPCNCKESKTKEQECPDGKTWNPDTGKCEGPKDTPEEKKENLGGGPDGETAGIDQSNPPAPCGDGQKLDGDGQCVPADNSDAGSPVSTAPKESKTWIPNVDEINASLKEHKEVLDTLKQRINNTAQVDELKAMENSIKKNLYSVTKLSPSGTGFVKDDIAYIAQEGRAKLRKDGNYNFSLDLSPEWVNESFGRKKVEEAISFSGDQSNKLAAMNDVFVLPGGKHIKSIRDLVRFVEIPDGADLVKLFKGDIPNNSSITEGSVETPGTHTVTTVTLAADTVTGVAQEITQSQVEDSPFEIFDYIAQTARAEVLEHEATLVFDTAAAAATPGSNINSAGTGTFQDTYVAEALEHWETQGYDTSFGNAYIVLHPRQLRELRVDSDISRFVQQGDANITKTGRLTHLYGVELIPSTAVNATTNYHAVGGIKGHTFALASKRELMIDMRKIPRESAFDWMWTQRKNAVAFDATSYVEIESASS